MARTRGQTLFLFLLGLGFLALFLYNSYRAIFESGNTALLTYSIVVGLVVFFLVDNFVFNKQADTITKLVPIVVVLGAFFFLGKLGVVPGIDFSLLTADIQVAGSTASLRLDSIGFVAAIAGIFYLWRKT